jgi:hypothetical protein
MVDLASIRESWRGAVHSMAKKEQNKVKEKGGRRTFRPYDFPPEWSPVHHRIQTEELRWSSEETDSGDQIFKETWI